MSESELSREFLAGERHLDILDAIFAYAPRLLLAASAANI